MSRVYLAGKMRGLERFGFPAFDAARDRLTSEGWTVISPADLDRAAGFDPANLPASHDWNDVNVAGFSFRDAVARDLEAIQTCDAIYMLKGWQDSKGARAERALAEWLGLEVLFESEESILDEAARITGGERNQSYGHPKENFGQTAAIWSAIKGVPFTAAEVALFMIAVKISRETHAPKRDNWVDMAGYAWGGSVCQ